MFRDQLLTIISDSSKVLHARYTSLKSENRNLSFTLGAIGSTEREGNC